MTELPDDIDFLTMWYKVQDHVAERENISFADRNKPENYNFAEKIALIHSELSEALEAHRKGLRDDHLPQYEGETVELADAVIRIMGIADSMKLPIAKAILDKARYNDEREDHKPRARRGKNGKKF